MEFQLEKLKPIEERTVLIIPVGEADVIGFPKKIPLEDHKNS